MTTDNSFKELDSILFPVLASRPDAKPAEIALALLARAGDQKPLVAEWIASRCTGRSDQRTANRSGLVALATSRGWPALMAKANRFSDRDTLDAAPVAARIAARLFLPLPGAGRNEILLRAAFACIGSLQIESIERDGMDTLLLGSPTLAVHLGVSIPTAKKALNQLAEFGWIKVVSSASGSARRIRIPHLNRTEYAVIQDRPELVALIQDSESLVRLVNHPAFDGNFRAWLWAVSELGQVDSRTLGLNQRELKKLTELSGEMGLTEPAPREALDGWADLLELDLKREAAEARRVALAAERKAEIVTSRSVATKARGGLDVVMGRVGRMPHARAAAGTKADYAIDLADAVREELSELEPDPALEAAIGRELVRRGRVAGWAKADLELLSA